MTCLVSWITVATLGGSVTTQEGPWTPTAHDRLAVARLESPPLGLPAVPVPEDNPVTAAKVALGRKLFFDRRLSANGTMSCGMCHIPEQGFTNRELSRPVGIGGRSLRRNAPTVLNSAYVEHLFLDGREPTLEAQATRPLLAADEMGNPSEEALLEGVRGLDDYGSLFEAAFDGGPSLPRIARALATWQRSLLAGAAPFDRWRFGGDPAAFDARQVRGFELFTGKAGCARCHRIGERTALFTDHEFHNTGVGALREDVSTGADPIEVAIAPGVSVSVTREVLRSVGDGRPPDDGRQEVTREPGDRWSYRTPSLRNVALTAPYMHDGSLPTLEAVVQFYDRGGGPNPGLDPRLEPLGLDDGEIGALVSFLGGLTAGNLEELIADARSVAVGN